MADIKSLSIAIQADPAQLIEGMRRISAVSPMAAQALANLGAAAAGMLPGLERIAQQHAEREQYLYQAQMLGVSLADAEAFEAELLAYAQTTLHPNTDVWRAGWSDAIERLKRGEDLPTVPSSLNR